MWFLKLQTEVAAVLSAPPIDYLWLHHCVREYERLCVCVCHFFQALSIINRAQIIDDAFNLAR